jgi:hypothetical protein
MTLERLQRPRFWQIAAVVLLAVIFWIDTLTPLGVSIPMLYVVPTILFVSAARFAEPLIVAAIASVLTVARLYVSASAELSETVLINRFITINVIWAAAGLVVAYVRTVERWTQEVTGANLDRDASLRRLQRYRIRARSVSDRRSNGSDRQDHIRQRQVLRDFKVFTRRADRSGSSTHQLTASSKGVHSRLVAHDRAGARLAGRIT